MTDDEGHSPHSTLSYDAPEYRECLSFEPIDWRVNEVPLVVGEDTPPGYRYRILEQWPLRNVEAQVGTQLGLL